CSADRKIRKLAKIQVAGQSKVSTMVASLGDARSFKNGQQVSTWLALVPNQNSTGDKTVLLGVSKRREFYLRTLLILVGTVDATQHNEKTAGLAGYLSGVTPMWQPFHWLIKTPELSGPCWSVTADSAPIARPPSR